MANNLVVQLLLKTGTFSTDLKQAKGQVQNFQKGCQTAGKSLSGFGQALGINVGALAKFGGAVGAAVLAGKELKAIIDSNQTSADNFQGAIAGCKGVLDSFNQAIATADFSAFRDGIWSIYDAAKAARDAMDDLNDAALAYTYLSSENMTKFQEAYNVFKDPKATKEMKEAAKGQMKEAVDAQFDYAKAYGKKQYQAYVTQVVKEAGAANLPERWVTNSQFQKAMRIKLGLEGDTNEITEWYDREYKKYLSELKKYGKNNIMGQEELKKKYRDVIAIRAMIKGMNDDQLKDVVQIITGMQQAEQQALSMEKTMNRALGKDDTKESGNSKKLKDEIPVMKESLTYWERLAKKAKEHRDAEVYNSEGWKKYNNDLEEALGKIEEINQQIEIAQKRQFMEENPLTPINNPLLQGKAEVIGNTITTPKTQAELQHLIDIFENMKKELKEGDPLIEEFNKQIDELRKRLEKFKTAGVELPTVKKNIISSWEAFNQTMANTASIVNALSDTFKEGTEVTTASILEMVATALPALGSLIGSIYALTAAEETEAEVSAVAKAVTSAKHWIEAIAAIAALSAAVASAISAARKTQPQSHFATGGIVGGTSFTGDRVSAQVNSGEMILTKAQQARLFRMANGSEGDVSKQVTFHISGTDLVGVLDNNIRKQRIIR